MRSVFFLSGLALSAACLANTSNVEERHHKLNFSPFQFGYEYTHQNNFHAGADLKFTPMWGIDGKESKKTSYFTNVEMRMGYVRDFNKFHIMGYGGIGYSHFKDWNNEVYLKDWSYLLIGLRPTYSITDVFEMGLHLKGYRNSQLTIAFGDYDVLGTNRKWQYEIGIPCMFHFGHTDEWVMQIEPYFLQVPGTKYVGSRLTFGFLF